MWVLSVAVALIYWRFGCICILYHLRFGCALWVVVSRFVGWLLVLGLPAGLSFVGCCGMLFCILVVWMGLCGVLGLWFGRDCRCFVC